MPPITTATVTLFCPFPNGDGKQSVLIPLNDFDGEHNLISNPTLTATVNTEASSVIEAIVNPSGTNPSEVKIRTKAPKPVDVSSGTVTISDGRIKNDGTPVPPVVVTIQLEARIDASSLEIPADAVLTPVDEP